MHQACSEQTLLPELILDAIRFESIISKIVVVTSLIIGRKYSFSTTTSSHLNANELSFMCSTLYPNSLILACFFIFDLWRQRGFPQSNSYPKEVSESVKLIKSLHLRDGAALKCRIWAMGLGRLQLIPSGQLFILSVVGVVNVCSTLFRS